MKHQQENTENTHRLFSNHCDNLTLENKFNVLKIE